MVLENGARLGRYQIQAAIGAGGMGEVYRASDRELEREVAIKVLPESVAHNPKRLERFRREARSVARISHPNVLQLFDFGCEAEIVFTVTELLEGRTLRERLGEGPPALRKALDIAAQVADGLAAAHARGVVHRDIKPENLFITAEGRVKILDFGLARVELEKEASEGDAETRTLTAPGTVMGTVGYMSPEQVRGGQADSRSDIFALGCVLYEVVCGQRAFTRDTAAETMSAILKEEPAQLSDSGVIAPAQVEHAIRRCLEKEPEARFQSASDLAYLLRSISGEAEAVQWTPTAVKPPWRRRPSLRLPAATVIVIAAGVFGWFLLERADEPLPPPRAIQLTTLPGPEILPALSPDGRQVAFSRRGDEHTDLFITLVDGGEPLLVGHGVGPAWSPDCTRIAVARGADDAGGQAIGGVFEVPALGGSERRIGTCTSPGISWSPDGSLLAMVDRAPGEDQDSIFLLALDNGRKTRLTTPPGDHLGDGQPRFSPDGRAVAFVRRAQLLEADVYLIPTSGGEPRRLTFDGMNWGMDWTADGASLVFSSERPGRTPGTNLWRVPAGGGEPEQLQVGEGGTFPTVSRQGSRLAYLKTDDRVDIWRVRGPAARGDDLPATNLITSTQVEAWPRYSPDGARILFASNRSGSLEIWVCDSDGSDPTQLTHLGGPAATAQGRWSPDGESIVFVSNLEGSFDLYLASVSGGSFPRRLTSDPAQEAFPNWSRDGRRIYFSSDRSGDWQVYWMSAEGGEPVQLTSDGGTVSSESPDGRHLYYAKSRSGYITVETGPRGIWRMPTAGGNEVQVLDQGDFCLWEVLEDGICLVNQSSDPPAIELYEFSTGTLTEVASLEIAPSSFGFAVSPDGRWVLYQGASFEADIFVVENFL